MDRFKFVLFSSIFIFSVFASDVDAKIVQNLDFFLEMELMEDEYIDIADEADSAFLEVDSADGAEE